LTEQSIGTGGWSCFNVPERNRLNAYSRVFDFEVNSTFYIYPPFELFRSWRTRVPSNFEFALRCHRDLTHRYLLEPREESYQVMRRMLSACRLLRAETLVLQTPTTTELTDSRLNAIKNFLQSAYTQGVQLVWKVRTYPNVNHNGRLSKLMEDQGITHCVHISRGEMPIVKSGLPYTRLFGPGFHNVYQYTDKELTKIHKVSTESGFQKAILSFHGTRMYTEASRLNFYEQKGEFPKVTNSIGLESLKKVLTEDVNLPATKEELIRKKGWKVIDITETQRVKASQLLGQLVN
jgi:uncharacterized protein YecE (DUF72 family)